MARINGMDSVLYADGTRFSLPPILRSSNGWVYKPDVMRTEWEIKRGKNKVFSRSDGDREARQFLEAHLREHFSDRDWEKPVAVGNPNSRINPTGRISYNVAWEDPVWGWVGLSLSVSPSRDGYGRTREASVSYAIHSHDVADMLVFKRVSSWSSGSDTTLTHVRKIAPENEKEMVPRLVQAWKADPWGVTCEVMTNPRIREIFEEPGEALKQVTFIKEDGSNNTRRYEASDSGLHLDENGFWAESSGNIEFFEKDVIRSILKSDFKWEALTELVEALKFCGVEVSISEEWTYTSTGREKVINGIKITAPKQGDRHRHVMNISVSNLNPRVEVDCGYEDDERLWLERKQRQAVEQLASLEEELQTFEIDLG